MDNVISLFSNRARPGKEVPALQNNQQAQAVTVRQEKNQPASIVPVSVEPSDFQSVAARNKANEDRLRKDRAQANKNVLKSYRIK